MAIRAAAHILSLTAILCGCDDQTPAPAGPTPSEKCPHASMDGMAGKWIKYTSAAVKEYRFEIVEEDGGYTLWYTGGGFTKKALRGERRTNDIKFTEIPDPKRKAMYESGSISLTRLYVEPRPTDCSLRVSEMALEWKGSEKEKPKGGFSTYVLYPPVGATLTFRTCDDPLFIGAAASDYTEAQAQLARSGAPEPAHQLGEAIPIGMWSDAAADGDPSCTYDMDLFFDDTTAKDAAGNAREAIPAGAVEEGRRSWLVPDWYAPYSGNHHFEMYRYRTCGGARELIGVACLEGILG